MQKNLRSNSFYQRLFSQVCDNNVKISKRDFEVIQIYMKILEKDPYNLSLNNALNETCVLYEDENKQVKFGGFDGVNLRFVKKEEIKEK